MLEILIQDFGQFLIQQESEVKVTLQDVSQISSIEKLSFQVLVCHLLFQQIETRINNVPISNQARLYPFRAISYCIYSFPTDSKKTLLQSEGFLRELN